jgi:hypothetical protein
MLEGAERLLGEPVTPRRLVDWTELGLLPAPHKQRRPDGARGSAAFWSPAGYLLWLNLLASQKAAGADIAGLANAPVGLWLYTDVGWVELVQVRRALLTWRARRTGTRTGQLTRSSAELVRRIAHPTSAPWARRRLRELLAAPDFDRSYSSKRIRTAVQAVVAPGRVGDTAGTMSAVWVGEHVARQLIRRFVGLTVLPMHPYDESRDGLMLEARLTARVVTAEHASSGMARTLDTRLGADLEPVGWVDRIQVACLDLVTAIGAVRLRQLGVADG